VPRSSSAAAHAYVSIDIERDAETMHSLKKLMQAHHTDHCVPDGDHGQPSMPK
jgi:hypothetical protein